MRRYLVADTASLVREGEENGEERSLRLAVLHRFHPHPVLAPVYIILTD
jgi:hypothetical protein